MKTGSIAALALIASALPAQSVVGTISGDVSGDFLGLSVAGVGDVDGDGFDDFAFGVRGDDQKGTESGAARIHSGQTGALLLEVFGDSAWDYFGLSVAGVGDVDGDGRPDVAIGAPRDDSHVYGGNSGTVWVWSVVDNRLIYKVRGRSANEEFGRFVDGLGDVDNDGFDDFVVGAPFADSDTGSAHIVSGRTGDKIRDFSGVASGDEFGRCVGGAGDVDGDGYPDVIVGARLHDHSGLTDAGAVYVFSGADGTPLHTWVGTDDRAEFGQSVQGAGDVDGDGFDDVVVGAHLDNTGGDDGGSVFVFSGRTGAQLWRFNGAPGSNLGRSVDAAGDVDGDGYADIVAGADTLGAGAVFVFSGRTGSQLIDVRGNASGDRFGHSVACAGDFDGDGFDDLIAGGYLTDGAGGADVGGVKLISSDAVGIPARVRLIGGACPTSLGRLPRTYVDGRPALGDTVTIGLRSAMPATGAWVQLGLRTELPLDAIGGYGCTLQVLPVAAFGFAVGIDGLAEADLSIPGDPVLTGVQVVAQWIVADLFANGLGASTSTAALLRVGN